MACAESDTDWSRWLHGWAVASSAGVCAALLMWSAATVVWTAAMAAVCALVVLAVAGPVPGEGPPGPPRRPPGTAAGVALLAGSGTVAAAVLASVSGVLLLVVLVAGYVSSPPFLRRLRRLGSSVHPAALPTEEEVLASYQGPPTDVGSLGALSDRQLCAAWRRSFVALQDARLCAEKSRVVALRQAYLDELETRSAEALLAWLESGARASGGPDRFLRASGDDDHPYAA